MIGLGVTETLLIGGGLLLVFGARKIPLIARGIGESIRNFKRETSGKSVEDAPEQPRLEDPESGER